MKEKPLENKNNLVIEEYRDPDTGKRCLTITNIESNTASTFYDLDSLEAELLERMAQLGHA